MGRHFAALATKRRERVMSEINLRPWQSEALNKATKWFSRGDEYKHFLINAAPGAGKTICASVIAKKLIDDGVVGRVIVIAPRSEVVRQWAEEYKFVTGRHMARVTGADADIQDLGLDLCATWAAIQGLLDGFQQVCRSAQTLVICDEHHHAAVEAAWGRGAQGAFADAVNVLVLTGTPARSDGGETAWMAFDDNGAINHPEDGTYTLSYGEAVDLDYCRPITFHRHEGKFSVTLPDGEAIAVSGVSAAELDGQLQKIQGLQNALEYYRLACTPKLRADGSADVHSYQGTMLEWAIKKLDDMREQMPQAGGLVIAPSIGVAEYMADLLEIFEGERPIIVHSQMANAENRIAAFKNTDKRWLVSVAMISEGVDIPRLRILVYLPSAQTELAFRQAMGRVVRSMGPDDYSRAYVVMPTHKIFEEFARRVEHEMSVQARREPDQNHTKSCPACSSEVPKASSTCPECGFEFPVAVPRMKTCGHCDSINPIGASECQVCGESFRHDFEVTLKDALRMGAIIRGMDLDEAEVVEGEEIKDDVYESVLRSGDEVLVKIIRQVPEEAMGRLLRMAGDAKSKK